VSSSLSPPNANKKDSQFLETDEPLPKHIRNRLMNAIEPTSLFFGLPPKMTDDRLKYLLLKGGKDVNNTVAAILSLQHDGRVFKNLDELAHTLWQMCQRHHPKARLYNPVMADMYTEDGDLNYRHIFSQQQQRETRRLKSQQRQKTAKTQKARRVNRLLEHARTPTSNKSSPTNNDYGRSSEENNTLQSHNDHSSIHAADRQLNPMKQRKSPHTPNYRKTTPNHINTSYDTHKKKNAHLSSAYTTTSADPYATSTKKSVSDEYATSASPVKHVQMKTTISPPPAHVKKEILQKSNSRRASLVASPTPQQLDAQQDSFSSELQASATRDANDNAVNVEFEVQADGELSVSFEVLEQDNSFPKDQQGTTEKVEKIKKGIPPADASVLDALASRPQTSTRPTSPCPATMGGFCQFEDGICLDCGRAQDSDDTEPVATPVNNQTPQKSKSRTLTFAEQEQRDLIKAVIHGSVARAQFEDRHGVSVHHVHKVTEPTQEEEATSEPTEEKSPEDSVKDDPVQEETEISNQNVDLSVNVSFDVSEEGYVGVLFAVETLARTAQEVENRAMPKSVTELEQEVTEDAPIANVTDNSAESIETIKPAEAVLTEPLEQDDDDKLGLGGLAEQDEQENQGEEQAQAFEPPPQPVVQTIGEEENGNQQLNELDTSIDAGTEEEAMQTEGEEKEEDTEEGEGKTQTEQHSDDSPITEERAENEDSQTKTSGEQNEELPRNEEGSAEIVVPEPIASETEILEENSEKTPETEQQQEESTEKTAGDDSGNSEHPLKNEEESEHQQDRVETAEENVKLVESSLNEHESEQQTEPAELSEPLKEGEEDSEKPAQIDTPENVSSENTSEETISAGDNNEQQLSEQPEQLDAPAPENVGTVDTPEEANSAGDDTNEQQPSQDSEQTASLDNVSPEDTAQANSAGNDNSTEQLENGENSSENISHEDVSNQQTDPVEQT